MVSLLFSHPCTPHLASPYKRKHVTHCGAGLLHWTRSPVPSIFLQIKAFHPSSYLNNTLLYRYIAFTTFLSFLLLLTLLPFPFSSFSPSSSYDRICLHTPGCPRMLCRPGWYMYLSILSARNKGLSYHAWKHFLYAFTHLWYPCWFHNLPMVHKYI